MSYYGDSGGNVDKNNLRDEILYFLDEHSIEELLEIITDAVRDHGHI